MKTAIAILLLSIAVLACVVLSRMQVSSGEPLTPAGTGEPAPPAAMTGRSADGTSRATHRPLETAPAALPIPQIGERDLSERLWTEFNSDLHDQNQFVEHERVVQLIRDDPDLARALTKEAAQ